MIVRQDNNSGLYYEGSLRYGRMDADYASGDLIGADGEKYMPAMTAAAVTTELILVLAGSAN